jgi:hypothetical protein
MCSVSSDLDDEYESVFKALAEITSGDISLVKAKKESSPFFLVILKLFAWILGKMFAISGSVFRIACDWTSTILFHLRGEFKRCGKEDDSPLKLLARFWIAVQIVFFSVVYLVFLLGLAVIKLMLWRVPVAFESMNFD